MTLERRRSSMLCAATVRSRLLHGRIPHNRIMWPQWSCKPFLQILPSCGLKEKKFFIIPQRKIMISLHTTRCDNLTITMHMLCYPDTRVLIFLPSRIPRTCVGFRHPCRIPSVICRVPKNSNESDTRTRVGHRHPHPCPCNTMHIKWLPSFCLLQTCLIGLLFFFFLFTQTRI